MRLIVEAAIFGGAVRTIPSKIPVRCYILTTEKYRRQEEREDGILDANYYSEGRALCDDRS